MTLYNLETLAMEEILGKAGRAVSDTYRTSSSNTAVIAYASSHSLVHLDFYLTNLKVEVVI